MWRGRWVRAIERWIPEESRPGSERVDLVLRLRLEEERGGRGGIVGNCVGIGWGKGWGG